MKKTRILGMIISICLLLQGCGVDNENTDTSPQESQQEEAVTESVLDDGTNGKDAEQTVENAGSENEIEQAAEETSWIGSSYMRAYRQFLELYVKESKYTQWARITLAFIDDDNVPELLLIEDNSHPAGVKVYTYYQESVIELGEFGSIGSMQYVERAGMIYSGWSGMGEGVSDFYRVEDGEAKLVCSIRNYEPFDGSPETYEIDGVSATEEAINKKYGELYDAYEYTLIGYEDAFAIGESEITDLLAEAQNALLLQKESPRLAEMVAKQSKVLEGYGTFLTEYASQGTWSNSEEVPAFSLIYLDSDDVPELIVIEGYAYACGGYVYTFEEGEVIPVGEYGVIDYGMCRTLTDDDMQSALTEELENLILTQEEVLKQNVLIAAGAQENDILLLDYDDYDRDGKYEVFMICGNSYEEFGRVKYKGALYFAGADCCMLVRDNLYRMIDGKMEFHPGRKYLFFYTDLVFTANESELWTVRDAKPVEESDLFQSKQVVYRGGNDFEVWVDEYDNEYDTVDDLWSGHTWKPYFYHYNDINDQIEAYEGEVISEKEFEEISGTNLIEEIESEGYTVGTIIRWGNDVVTINYTIPVSEYGFIFYKNVIWDNKVKDFWQKDARGVTSWENAGEGGSYSIN